MTDLRVKRGDKIEISIAAKKRDGSVQPLTGMTLRFTAKDRIADLDAAAVISKTSSPANGITIDDAVNGLATVTILKADTASFTGPRTLLWDLQMSDGAGEPKTLDDGLLYVRPDVSRTAP